MKISKIQLRRIIKEEYRKLVENSGAQAGIDDYLEIFELMDDAYDEKEMTAKLSDEGLEFNPDTYSDALDDYERALSGDDNRFMENAKMKLSKTQLKRIIREEYQRVLNEYSEMDEMDEYSEMDEMDEYSEMDEMSHPNSDPRELMRNFIVNYVDNELAPDGHPVDDPEMFWEDYWGAWERWEADGHAATSGLGQGKFQDALDEYLYERMDPEVFDALQDYGEQIN